MPPGPGKAEVRGRLSIRLATPPALLGGQLTGVGGFSRLDRRGCRPALLAGRSRHRDEHGSPVVAEFVDRVPDVAERTVVARLRRAGEVCPRVPAAHEFLDR